MKLYNPEAEGGLVAAGLINPAVLHELSDVRPDQFHSQWHGQVWAALLALHEAHEPIDVVTVAAKAGVDMGELVRLFNEYVSSMHAEGYADIVREDALRRQVLEIASRAATLAHDRQQSAIDVYRQVLEQVQNVDVSVAAEGAKHISDVLRQFDDDLQGNVAASWPSGMRSFDRMLGGGLREEEVTMLAGLPKKGKSILATHAVVNMARAGAVVYIAALEMRNRNTISRIISGRSTILEQELSAAGLTNKLDEYYQQVEELSSLPIYISDRADWSLEALRADIYRVGRERRVNVLLVDYLGLLADNPNIRDEYNQLTYKTRGLVKLARAEKLAVLAIHTLTTDGTLRGGTGPGHAVDLALSIWGDDDYQARLGFGHPNKRNQPEDNIVWVKEEMRRYGTFQPAAEMVRATDRPYIGELFVPHSERSGR